MHAGTDRLVGVNRFGAAPQDCRVTGFQTQSGRICRDVGARFINDTDDPKRYAHSAHLNSARAVAHVADFANRIGKSRDLAQTVRHCGDTILVEAQAIDHCRLEPLALCRFDILAVGFEQACATTLDGRCHFIEGNVFCARFRARDFP